MTTINATYEPETGEMVTAEVHVNQVAVTFEARHSDDHLVLVPIEIETHDLDESYNPLKAYASPFEIASAVRSAAKMENVDSVARFESIGLDGDLDE